MHTQLGLIAEGGGMRGAYTAGVLEAFLDHNFQVPYAIGVSAGANTLCSYLSKQKLRNKRLYTEWIMDKRFINWRNLFTEGAYFGMHFLFDDLPTHLDPFDFEGIKKCSTTLKVGVTNCLSGQCEFIEPLTFSNLSAFNQVFQASSSLPFISKMVTMNGIPYLDGGISDAIPIHQAQQDGYTYNVVILTRNVDYRKHNSKTVPTLARYTLKKYPNLVKAIERRARNYNATLDYLTQLEKEGKVFIIRPAQPLQVDRFEKDQEKLIALYNQGYEEACRHLPRLCAWSAQITS